MFKKSFFIATFLLIASVAYASFDIRESVCSSMSVGTVSVSTITPTLIAVGGANLPGRTRITIENTDAAMAVFIGTYSAVAVTDGYKIHATTITSHTISLPVGSGMSIYGRGTASATLGPVNVRVIECAQ